MRPIPANRSRSTWMFGVVFACVLAGVPLVVTVGLASAQESADDAGLPVEESSARWTARAEFQLWWTKGNPVPALATQSPDGTDRSEAGVLGTPGVQVLAGDEQFDRGVRPGGRLTILRTFDAAPSLALEVSGLFLGDGRSAPEFFEFSPGSPILSRPFFNAVDMTEDAELVAYPDILEGALSIQSTSELVSPELNLQYWLRDAGFDRIHVLAGYRYLRLRESLVIRENLESIDQGGLVPLGTTLDVEDRFATRNEFHGGQLGLRFDVGESLVTWSFLAKVALGNLRQVADISGNTVVTIPGLPATSYVGGLLAQPTNIGQYQANRFAVLPEFGATAKVRLIGRLDMLVGYSFLYLNDVARTGAQIDRQVNTSQIGGDPLVGVARPRFEFNTSELWAQSLNLGFEYQW